MDNRPLFENSLQKVPASIAEAGTHFMQAAAAHSAGYARGFG
jgi:hypothetical protein